MNLFEKLKMTASPKPGLGDFCIQTLRFQRLLEDAGALLALFEDGHEKSSEEYIFDVHYVNGLIDGAMEKLGLAVYDASTLAPGAGEALYCRYDMLKLQAKTLLAGSSAQARNRNGQKNMADAGAEYYPEDRLLSDTLKWFEEDRETPGVRDCLKQALWEGVCGIESLAARQPLEQLNESLWYGTQGRIYLVDLWRDAVAPPAGNQIPAQIRSTPLQLLMTGAAEGAPSHAPDIRSQTLRWLAVAAEAQVSLSLLSPQAHFRLDTHITGNPQSDYVFICAQPSNNIEPRVLSGFLIEEMEQGCLAWKRGISVKSLEQTLVSIGCGLFGGDSDFILPYTIQ